MDVSIVIVSYNTQELLHDCLRSVISATKGIYSEIFVVDNNSSDKTVQMVSKFFPTVNLIVNNQNLGFSKANNQAIKKTKGKCILVLNPDTKLMPDTIKKMVSFMQRNQDVAVSTCKVDLVNGKLDKDCRRLFPNPWRAFCYFSGIAKLFKGSKIFDQYHMGYISQNKEHEVDSCMGAFMFIRASALKKVGLFDEDFFFYGEDLDLCWRFKEKGFKIVYTPITKIIHYKGASSGIKKSSKEITKASVDSKKLALTESVHAMQIFYSKHYAKTFPFFINWPVNLFFRFLLLMRLTTLRA